MHALVVLDARLPGLYNGAFLALVCGLKCVYVMSFCFGVFYFYCCYVEWFCKFNKYHATPVCRLQNNDYSHAAGIANVHAMATALRPLLVDIAQRLDVTLPQAPQPPPADAAADGAPELVARAMQEIFAEAPTALNTALAVAAYLALAVKPVCVWGVFFFGVIN